jgi:hypothetical protein
VGKGRQAAKTEIERLKLGEIGCEQGVTEVAKMCAPASSAACYMLHNEHQAQQHGRLSAAPALEELSQQCLLTA